MSIILERCFQQGFKYYCTTRIMSIYKELLFLNRGSKTPFSCIKTVSHQNPWARSEKLKHDHSDNWLKLNKCKDKIIY